MTAIKFHPVHGENVQLSEDGFRVTRWRSFCKAVVFSSRPMELNETVRIRLVEVQKAWNGVLRLGVTNKDPMVHTNNMPRYLCPDLAKEGGCWAKALSEDLCKTGAVVQFCVRPNGDMLCGVNGPPQNLYLTGINTMLPIYVVMDIYGNTTCVEFVAPQPPPPERANDLQQHQPQRAVEAQPQQRQLESPMPQATATATATPTARRDSPRYTGALTVKLPPVAAAPEQSVRKSSLPAASSVPVQPPNPAQSTPSTSSAQAPPTNECSVCMHRLADSAVYPCGHVLMCYDCGRMTWSRQGVCPVCRKEIKDIIKLYLSI